VLGAETAVGAAVVAGLTGSGFAVRTVSDDDPIPGETGAVIDAGPLREPLTVGELVSLSQEEWAAVAEAPLRRALHVLQRAHQSLRGNGGRIVVLLPSLVMTGAAGVAAASAAAEGYRSLAKAAARAWGAERIAIQCVLVPTDINRPGLQPPALQSAPDLASVLAALLDPRLDLVTGLTLAADGGIWMTS
jgi:3-oxoacyl-[acyl-carrier protein] reductase